MQAFSGKPPSEKPQNAAAEYVPSVPGTFCPFSIDLHINQAQVSQVSLGRPEFVPGTPPGHPDRQIPLCDFSLSVFFSP